MNWEYDDGGRKLAGLKGETGDCSVRAVSIAMQRDYSEVYKELVSFAESERPSKRRKGKSHPRTGYHRDTFRRYMKVCRWEWVPTMHIGSGCKVHLFADELPTGRIICSVSKHYVAVIDGVIHDTHDPSREGKRCVYGYWRKEREATQE